MNQLLQHLPKNMLNPQVILKRQQLKATFLNGPLLSGCPTNPAELARAEDEDADRTIHCICSADGHWGSGSISDSDRYVEDMCGLYE